MTLSLTESHCLATDASEKSNNGLLIGSEAIPMDREPKKSIQIANIATEFVFVSFIFISFQEDFSI